MAEELKTRFTKARLAAIAAHELREGGHSQANAHVVSVPQLGYLVVIDKGDEVTVRVVEEPAED